MHILRAKIALDFQQTEERNIRLEHEYSPTFNRKMKLWLELMNQIANLLIA